MKIAMVLRNKESVSMYKGHARTSRWARTERHENRKRRRPFTSASLDEAFGHPKQGIDDKVWVEGLACS